jgi:hypothetical protein
MKSCDSIEYRLSAGQAGSGGCRRAIRAEAACGHSQKFTAQRDVFEIGCYGRRQWKHVCVAGPS